MSEKPPIDSVLEALGADLPPLPESGYVKMRCFHHSEDNPSATVNKEKGTYKCFVCEGLSGDGYAIVMAVMGLDFIGSVKWVEENVGFERSTVSRKSDAKPRRSSLFVANRGAGTKRRDSGRVSTRRRRPRLR